MTKEYSWFKIDCPICGNGLREFPKQEQGEPYGYFRYDIRLDAWVQSRDNNKGVAFYTKPQQRKPLTRKDIDRLHEEDCFSVNIYEITAEIEAAHGIKE